MNFQLKASFEHGSSIFYPHLKYHPADYKVALLVKVEEMGLTAEQTKIFIEMVGPRYNTGKRIVKLTATRFPNRLENKKYLIYLLERLAIEARKLSLLPDSEKYVQEEEKKGLGLDAAAITRSSMIKFAAAAEEEEEEDEEEEEEAEGDSKSLDELDFDEEDEEDEEEEEEKAEEGGKGKSRKV